MQQDGERVGQVIETREIAAKKIAAIHRGNTTRSEMDMLSVNATKVQSLFRGKAARRQAGQLHASREVVEVSKATLKMSKTSASIMSVNDYHFHCKLGQGAFGQVYKASRGSKGSDEVAAVKVISRSILRRKRVGRFGTAYDAVMGEIAVMKALDHPNVVRLFEVIDDPEEDLLVRMLGTPTHTRLRAHTPTRAPPRQIYYSSIC